MNPPPDNNQPQGVGQTGQTPATPQAQQPVAPQQPTAAAPASNMQPQAAPQQPYMPQGQPQTPAPKMKKSKKPLAFLAAGLAFIGVLAFSVFILFGKTDAQADMTKAMQKFLSSEDVSAKMSITAEGLSAVVDIKSDIESSLSEIVFKVEIPAGFTSSELTVSAITSQDTLYLQTDGANDLIGQLLALGGGSDLADLDLDVSQLSSVDGIWYAINEDTMKNLLGSYVDISELDELGLDLDSVTNTSGQEEELQKIVDSYGENPLFVVGEKIDSKDINGRNATGYKVQLNDEATVERFLDDLKAAEISGLNEVLTQLGTTQITGAGENIDGLEVWLDGDDLARLVFADSQGELVMDLLDEDVNISLPGDSVEFDKSPLGEFLGSLIGNTFNGVQSRAMDVEAQADVSAIHTQLEVFYTDNGFYPTAIQYDVNIFPGIDAESFVNPQGGEYDYNPLDCTSSGCQDYSISADLEEDELGSDDLDGDIKDYVKYALNGDSYVPNPEFDYDFDFDFEDFGPEIDLL